MLLHRPIIQIVSRRLMASSAGSSDSNYGDKPPAPAKKSDSVTKVEGDQHDYDPFDGQTKINYNHDAVGFKQFPTSKDTFLNPLLTPPPRSPRTTEDFKNPARLGHWVTLGADFYDPVKDKYAYHEMMFFLAFGVIFGTCFYLYAPDVKLHDWARREAFLRTAKREALGLPLIDRDLVDPERIVLPTEEELENFEVNM